MNKSQIIASIYEDKSYRDICRNICQKTNYHDWEDLFHEVIHILLEKTEKEIVDAKEGKFLKFLFIRIASNQYHSYTSPFFLKYKGKLELTNIEELLQLENKIEPNEALNHIAETNQEFEETWINFVKGIESTVDGLTEYESELLKVWVKLDFSSAEIERRTGISQVRKTILKIKRKLIQKHGNDYFKLHFSNK
jgi:hypothetical protein